MSKQTQWRPHKHDAQIATLMFAPDGETVDQQRARCAKYGALVKERQRDLGHDAYAMAVERESEPQWWRDLGFIAERGADTTKEASDV